MLLTGIIKIVGRVMRHLIIIGAGGMGRSLYSIAQGCYGYQTVFDIKGFIDDDSHSMDGFLNYPPLLGTIKDYKVQENDFFVCAIGTNKIKKIVCDKLKANGAKFQKLVHKTAVIGTNAEIGDGSIIANYVIVSPDSKIGENSLIQDFAVVGHDCVVGNYVRIDTHSTLVGGTQICDGATIHTSSIINHNVVVGENAIVGAMSFVIRKVKSNTTVCGNPARKFDY